MRVLFIDDQREIRCEHARRFYEGCEFIHMMELPKSFKGYDVISFDNDLGHQDVADEMNRRFWSQDGDSEIVQGQDLIDQIKDKVLVVHSMNPVASVRLQNLFLGIGIWTTYRIQFNNMLDPNDSFLNILESIKTLKDFQCR